jgi:penicillin-binding protein 1A
VKTLFALLILVFEFALATALICALVIFYRFSHNLPDVSDLVNNVKPQIATTIYSQDNVLLGKLDVENRQPVAIGDISKDLINATIAIEDHRFYEHFGIDPQGIMRALVADFRGDSATRQGASTLTQQLIRNVGNFGLGRAKRYSRKIREALIAVRVEQVYTKQEILALYLNNVYYGGGAYGVQAAAMTYFGVPASRLDLSQAALLAGLPQRPSAYTPFEHRTAALKRRDEVLDAMLRYHYITSQQYSDARDERLKFLPQKKHRDYDFKAPYFVWSVLNELVRQYGVDFVYSGIRVDTTLNWKMQVAAEQQLENGLRSKSSEGCNQGCLVCLDNANGAIRALVGGRNFHASQYNHVTQGHRPPGSTFKLFDYAAAFDEGKCTIDDSFPDHPIEYPHGHGLVVHDFEPWSYRTMSCREAIAHSVNTIAVQVAELVGIEHVITYAHRMGITSPISADYPNAIGASAVRPLDLAVAYSVVANDGVRHLPSTMVRITEADGTVHEVSPPASESALLRHSTVTQLADGLEAVVDHGTGGPAKGDASSGIVDGARGKTGTTSEFRDAWFAGYVPELTTVIWVGSEHRDRHGTVRYATMGTATGGVVCAPIWHDFMIRAVPEQKRYLEAQRAALIVTPEHATVPVAPVQPSARKPSRPAAPAKAPDAGAGAASPTASTSASDGTSGVSAPPAVRNPGDLPPTLAPGSDAVVSSGSPAPPGNASTTTATQAAPPPRSASVTSLHPAVRAVVPAPEPPPDPEVDVTLCVDSHERATMWCPSTITEHMSRSRAKRLKRCTLHKPPPGAG